MASFKKKLKPFLLNFLFFVCVMCVCSCFFRHWSSIQLCINSFFSEEVQLIQAPWLLLGSHTHLPPSTIETEL